MSLNTSFDGYAFDSTNTLGNSNIYYQGLFYSAGTASSTTTWSDVRLIESSGYFSLNLGDSSWLSQEGTALAGARVLIVFWQGSSDRLSDCTLLTEWCNIEIVLTGADVYSTNVQTMPNISPILDWATNAGSHPYARTSYYFSNDSDDEHSWDFNGTTMYHTYTKYGQTFFNVNTIVETNFDWGNGETTLALEGAADSSHTWSVAGDYTVTMDIEDACGATATGTVDVRIYWRPPVPTLSRCDSAGNVLSSVVSDPDTPIYFKYTGTNDDDVIVSILWTIEDDGAYGSTTTIASRSATDIVGHSEGLGTGWLDHTATPLAFTNPGAHTVTTTIIWFDGFENQTLTYSNTITQNKFAGPYVSFTQDLATPEVWESLTLTNTTTNTGRVGLGLPDGDLYTWTWYDDDSEVTQTDVAYEYELVQTPQTANCHATLCAEWSDGFESVITCVTRDIVFKTSISVTPEDCYYVIDIVGTSTDGTVTDYGWTVSSGTSASGTFSLVWSSPIAVDQQNKTLCFSAIGWYKVEGTVYGTGYPTSDYKTLYVNETCPSEGTNIAIPIWDGTGILDVATDWVRIGYGYESMDSRHDGTHGLKVQAASILDDIIFHTTGYTVVDISDYAFLAFWINIRNWAQGADIIINMYSSTSSDHTALQLSNYVHFGLVGKWQRVMIPVLKFQLPIHDDMDGHPVYINTVKFSSLVGVDFWLDEVLITMGALVEQYLCGTYQNTFSATSEADVIGMTMAALNVPTSSVVNERALVPSFAINSSIAWTKDVPPNMDNISVDNVGNYSNILDSLEDTSNVPDAVITSGKTHLSRGYPLPDLQPVIVSTKRVVDKKASLTPISTIKTYPLPLDTES